MAWRNILLNPAKTAGRALMNLGGRANLLEEVGRIDAERMNPNRRAGESVRKNLVVQIKLTSKEQYGLEKYTFKPC